MDVIHYIQSNWFQILVDVVAALNVIAAGSRVMGWSKLSNMCGKLEEAISTMVQTALNRGGNNEKPTSGMSASSTFTESK